MSPTLPSLTKYVITFSHGIRPQPSPQDTVARSNTVALDFGRALFGPFGGVLFAVMVAISCFGAMNGERTADFPRIPHLPMLLGSFFTAARLIYVAGKEGYLPSLFGTLNPRLKTPLNAMLLQAAITIVFICFGDGFRSLINFAVIVSWLANFLTVSLFPTFSDGHR